MIQLPNFDKSFDYENAFYLSCKVSRMGKIIAQYELYKKVVEVPGSIVECGVFKGASLMIFSMLRSLLNNSDAKKIIAFDTFTEFPETDYIADKSERQRFIQEAGKESISKEQLQLVLEKKGIKDTVELVEGNIVETVPRYIANHPELKISLLNLDVDIYEPSVMVLDCLFPRIVEGGILILDDYGTFPGSTKAVDDYFQGKKVHIRKYPFCNKPSYLIKE